MVINPKVDESEIKLWEQLSLDLGSESNQQKAFVKENVLSYGPSLILSIIQNSSAAWNRIQQFVHSDVVGHIDFYNVFIECAWFH